jgi:hypothetical protein
VTDVLHSEHDCTPGQPVETQPLAAPSDRSIGHWRGSPRARLSRTVEHGSAAPDRAALSGSAPPRRFSCPTVVPELRSMSGC